MNTQLLYLGLFTILWYVIGPTPYRTVIGIETISTTPHSNISAANTSRTSANLTEEEIKATPEYKYRMTIVLVLQLYWSQQDHCILTRHRHTKFYVSKNVEINGMNDILNETYLYMKKKCDHINKLYKDIYDEKITWTARMTHMPIEQQTIDDLVHRWKKLEHMLDEQNRRKKPEGVPEQEIESMRRGIKLAEEELLIQYNTIQKKMKNILKIIEESKVSVLPDTSQGSIEHELFNTSPEIPCTTTQKNTETTTY